MIEDDKPITKRPQVAVNLGNTTDVSPIGVIKPLAPLDPNKYFNTESAPTQKGSAIGNFFAGVVNAVIPGSNLGDSNNTFRSLGEDVGIPLVATIAVPAIVGALSGGAAAAAAADPIAAASGTVAVPAATGGSIAVEAGGATLLPSVSATGVTAAGAGGGSSLVAIANLVTPKKAGQTLLDVASKTAPAGSGDMSFLSDLSSAIGSASKAISTIQNLGQVGQAPQNNLQQQSAGVQQPLQRGAQYYPSDDPVTLSAKNLVDSIKGKIQADPTGNQFSTASNTPAQVPAWVWAGLGLSALYLFTKSGKR